MTRTGDVVAEFFHRRSGDGHVFEHALQFRRKLATALVLQLGNHVLLAVVRHTLVEQQSLGCNENLQDVKVKDGKKQRERKVKCKP